MVRLSRVIAGHVVDEHAPDDQHTFVFTPGGSWGVVSDPHAAVCCDARGAALNLPVGRETCDWTTEVLRRAIDRGQVDRSEKFQALKRLAAFAARPPGTARASSEEARP